MPYMASKQITIGVGIPMMVVGGLIALLWAPAEIELKETIEFIGSLIGILARRKPRNAVVWGQFS